MSPAVIRFLSTPSARRATYGGGQHRKDQGISIHALREEGDVHQKGAGAGQRAISIHALREEGDRLVVEVVFDLIRFLSTPSARRATRPRCPGGLSAGYFYPRPPRGGRLDLYKERDLEKEFLSTPSARRATAKTETKSLFSYKLYNILHEFRRALIYNGSKNDPNHAK